MRVQIESRGLCKARAAVTRPLKLTIYLTLGHKKARPVSGFGNSLHGPLLLFEAQGGLPAIVA